VGEAPVSPEAPQEITRLLREWSGGDQPAGEELFELVYRELRQIAVGHMASEREGHTLPPTALVHEAFLRLCQIDDVDWRGRKHFYALMSRVIRRILIDYARRVGTNKRGGELQRVPMLDLENLAVEEPQRLLDLDDALTRLRELDPLQAEIVEYRFFGGLTMDEIAEATGRSPATVGRQFRVARLWLYRELQEYRS
jgi:RNA polymerase sigma factor (TIGR02999 family)